VHRVRPGDRSRRGAAIDDPQEIVRAGYDAIADRYAAWSASFESPVGAWVANSLVMLGHVPRAEQAPLLRRIAGWLRPGAWLLATMGTAAADDVVEADWLGAPMFFASFDEATNRRLLAEAGLDPAEARVVPVEEPGHGLVRFMWVLAQKSHSRHEAVTHT
jgi:hypothetical protein